MTFLSKYRKHKIKLLTVALVSMLASTSFAMPSSGLPEGLHDEKGVHINSELSDAKTLNIVVDGFEGSNKGIANWNDFGIAQGNTVRFSSDLNDWLVLNRVTGSKASNILGSLVGDGTIFLVNPNGITFGNGASVDVGSFVATTMDISDNDFKNNNFNFVKVKDNAITINELANITADKYVAILAYGIKNKGNITAQDVALAAGQKIALRYDDKIDLVVDVSKNDIPSTLDTEHGYILINSNDAKNLVTRSVISNTGTIRAAKSITRDSDGNVLLSGDGGNISIVAAKTNISGTLDASGIQGGTIFTSGYEDLQITPDSKIHAKSENEKPGTWNAVGALINVGSENERYSISNTAVSDSLKDTSVNLTASPITSDYYSDVSINKAIEKTSGKDVALTLTAGRNVNIDSDIKSSEGKMDVLLAGDSSKSLGKTNSMRGDGANIIRGNIETNGGNFETASLHSVADGQEHLSNGTYFGVKERSQAGNVDRHIYTNGGDIKLGGAEVLIATGNEVVFDTTSENAQAGKVTIDGTVNSANFYTSGTSNTDIKWSEANALANSYDKDSDGNPTGKSHLTVITSALEDAITSSTLDSDFGSTQEAYVGGHVVAVETNEDGSIKLDSNNMPIAKRDSNGNVVTIVNDVTNTQNASEYRKGGWYVESRDSEGKPASYARFWAWTVGEEAGKIIYKQTAGENIAGKNGFKDMPELDAGADPANYPIDSAEYKWLTEEHGMVLNDSYVNFAPCEPNDGGARTEGSQTALAVNHDTYFDSKRGDVLVSKWDDMPDGVGATTEEARKQIRAHNYAIEIDIGKSSLKVNAGETLFNNKIGNVSTLNNLTVNSSMNATAKESVQVENNITTNVAGSNVFEQLVSAKNGQINLSADTVNTQNIVTAGDSVSMNAKKDVKADDAVTASNNVSMSALNNINADVVNAKNIFMTAKNDVVANNVLTADKVLIEAGNDVTIKNTVIGNAKNTEDAVDIRAQKRFLNLAEDSSNVIKVGEGSHWKIYSNTPYDDNFGSGVNESTNKDLNSNNFAVWGWDGQTPTTETGNRYIFKYVPTLTYTADSMNDVTEGTTVSPVGYTFNNSLNGKFKTAFLDANDDLLLAREGMNTAKTVSEGYGTPSAGTYTINMSEHEGGKKYGYNVVAIPSQFNVIANQVPEPEPEPEPTPTPTPDPDPTPTPEPTPEPIPDTPVNPNPQPVPDQKPSSEYKESSKSEPVKANRETIKPQQVVERSIDRDRFFIKPELPIFSEKDNKVTLRGTYYVSVKSKEVSMSPIAKIMPEPDQIKNQNLSCRKELVTKFGNAVFDLTYNGSTLDIYPTDEKSLEILNSEIGLKSVDVESKALFAAIQEMGILLDNLDAIYVHLQERTK